MKKGIKGYIKERKLAIRYDIFHHCSASSSNLQVVDYISWAIFRKYEHKDGSYYNNIQKYLFDEELMTKDAEVIHYER